MPVEFLGIAATNDGSDGPRPPEARGLHLATGYTPLFDTEADPETIGPLPFEKHLPAATHQGKAANL